MGGNSFRMYRLWVCLLATETVAMAAAARSLRVLATWKGANVGWHQRRSNSDIGQRTTELRAARVERSRVQITVPARFFNAKYLLKVLLTPLLILLLAIFMCEMLIVNLLLLYMWQLHLWINIQKDPGVGEKKECRSLENRDIFPNDTFATDVFSTVVANGMENLDL